MLAKLSELQRAFWNQPSVSGLWTEDMQRFSRQSADLLFETRYRGEPVWWPVETEELARTLGAYYNDLSDCLERMLCGEAICSPVSEFRIRSIVLDGKLKQI
jgi:hypothetical protein